MLNNWLSRYNLRYPRSLAYMLQASEYNVSDYLSWYHKIKSFRQVERRKQFVGTKKGLLLLAIIWIIALLILTADVILLWLLTVPLKYPLFILILLILPCLLGYLAIIPVIVINLIGWLPRYIMIKRSKRILQRHPALKIGIAGSYGKTTMREIIKTVLCEGKKVAAPPHNYNTPISISCFVKTLAGDEEVLIFELGEYYPGDIKKLCHLVRPDIGIITGINESHLQKFKTLQRTIKTIYELADYLGTKPVYINGENELARSNARPGHILYDRQRAGDWLISDQKSGLNGTAFTLINNDLKLELKSSLLGLHQIGSLAAAANIAGRLGLSSDQITAGVSKTRPFDHRLEAKMDSAGVITLDDSYNGNPDGVAAVIGFLASLGGRRRFYVTPGLVEMGSKTESVHKEIGRQLAVAKIEKIILIKNSVTPFIEAGLKENNYAGEVLWFADGLAAFAALPYLTIKGDIILLQNDWPDQYQ